MRIRSGALAVALPLAAALLASACSSSSSAAGGSSTAAAASTAKIVAIGAENEYADVIGQIGGKYVSVSAIWLLRSTRNSRSGRTHSPWQMHDRTRLSRCELTKPATAASAVPNGGNRSRSSRCASDPR